MKDLIIVRGGGDLATAVIHRLFSAGFRVMVLESERPSAIRRNVAVCEAVYEGVQTVENMTARLVSGIEEAEVVIKNGEVPLMIDPQGSFIGKLKPEVVVDGIIAKKNLGTTIDMAPLTIGLGPGFNAGEDVDYVVETMRGHNLGRIIPEGMAQPNTGVPGNIGGYTKERVMHAEHSGIWHIRRDISEYVTEGTTIAEIEGADGTYEVKASITGIIRGTIHEGYRVKTGLKVADIDPREESYRNCFTISDKGRCIAGSVLELVCRHFIAKEISDER